MFPLETHGVGLFRELSMHEREREVSHVPHHDPRVGQGLVEGFHAAGREVDPESSLTVDLQGVKQLAAAASPFERVASRQLVTGG